jgi:hypothetical protein
VCALPARTSTRSTPRSAVVAGDPVRLHRFQVGVSPRQRTRAQRDQNGSTRVVMERVEMGNLEIRSALIGKVVDPEALAARTFCCGPLAPARGQGDFEDAQAAINRLAAVPTDPGFVPDEITLLRLGARLAIARARGDETAYRDYRDRYRAMATSLGFEGHMKWAEAMP